MVSLLHMVHHTGNNNDDIDTAFAHRGCCLWIHFFHKEPSHNNNGGWQRVQSQDTAVFVRGEALEDSPSTYPWWTRGWGKVKDWSGDVVVQQWRLFLRRFNGKKPGGGCGGGGGGGGDGDCVYNFQYGKTGKFQYDPKSYARNFDEGIDHFDEDLMRRGFSFRFSLPPGSVYSSLDFDKERVNSCDDLVP